MEIVFPSDRPADTENELAEWVESGVALAWLIDGDAKTVSIYGPNRPCEVRKGVSYVNGEGPVAGYPLDLADLWAGLSLSPRVLLH